MGEYLKPIFLKSMMDPILPLHFLRHSHLILIMAAFEDLAMQGIRQSISFQGVTRDKLIYLFVLSGRNVILNWNIQFLQSKENRSEVVEQLNGLQ